MVWLTECTCLSAHGRRCELRYPSVTFAPIRPVPAVTEITPVTIRNRLSHTAPSDIATLLPHATGSACAVEPVAHSLLDTYEIRYVW
jgi:hypothetical protein